MASLIQTVAPTGDVLSLSDAKRHVQEETHERDTELLQLIKRATDYAERLTNRQFLTATWRLSLDKFPAWTIWVPKPRFISVTTFTYVDTNGTTQTLVEGTDYQKDTDSEPGRLMPEAGTVWPSTEADRNNVVQLTYTAGYGAATAVPDAIKHAILMLLGHWFREKEGVITGTISKELEFAVSSILSAYAMPEYA